MVTIENPSTSTQPLDNSSSGSPYLLIFVLLYFAFHQPRCDNDLFSIPLSAIGGRVLLWARDMHLVFQQV